ncbi:MAG TPA: 23S rRNA (guanosine(2251)-2'-O)-methyltransferase RlmB [Xanthobacteraceae bacterium]|nr:23S rRNA (guanosine(2251)-2'-O)-methyltransferase RlmB [Xanthobacteraceae bacterium]
MPTHKKPFRGKKPWERGKRPFKRGPGRTTPRDRDGPAIIYGWHAVEAALKNPKRKIRRILTTQNGERRLQEMGVHLKVTPEVVRPDAIDRELSPDAVHQGILVEADPLPVPDLSEIPENGLVLVLDQITDPHNFGAILRSAAAFKVAAVVTTARHSPEATGVLAKSASGGLEYVPLVFVQNLARALTELKSRGFFLVGLAEEGEIELGEAKLKSPLALVMGAEGKGLRQLTRETCDVLARLDLPGEIKSLNVSNAAALALYIAHRRVDD